MFIASKKLAPLQMYDIFKLKGNLRYNLSYSFLFSRPLVKSVYKGTESWSFLESKKFGIYYQILYKDMPNLNSFKVDLKKWRPVSSPYAGFV